MHQYKRLLAVFLFLGILLAVFELSGLRDHFNLALGRTWGGIATYVAASLSCVMTFFTIRFVGGDALRQLNNKIAARLLRQLDAHPINSILLLRILFQTMPALNYALALSGVKFRDYLIGTLLGLPLPIILYCVFFDYLAKTLKVV
jgi:uncharacterized membrane protein YdjX (TVP38/TMEM64 family)